MMRITKLAITLLLLALPLVTSTAGHAKSFRWASQGDAATLDPHSQNETFNNSLNNLVYEYLVMRDRPVIIDDNFLCTIVREKGLWDDSGIVADLEADHAAVETVR